MSSASKRIVLPGGNGFTGRILSRYFATRGWDVVVLSRSPGRAENASRTFQWNGESLGDWAGELDGADVVVNLAGLSVNCRYNAANRQRIYDSRLKPTALLGEAIARCAHPPRVWLNSSTATIYRHAEDRPQDEATGEIGSGFSVDVAQQWERTFFDAPVPSTVRRVAMRSAIVLGTQKGTAFDILRSLACKCLGGRMGTGRQMVSWIHEHDFARAVEFLIDHPSLDGVVNIASPHPLSNREMMKTLRKLAGVPFGLPATRWMLEIGAVFLRTETELILKSRWVLPARLQQAGFTFEYPDFENAAAELIRR
jgi:uncharacterized protein (TIGR01777 family)